MPTSPTIRSAVRPSAEAALTAVLLLVHGGALLPAAWAADCPARALWPTRGWESQAGDVGARRPEAVATLSRIAFDRTGLEEKAEAQLGRAPTAEEIERWRHKTDALLVVKGGRIVFERYARGYGPDTKHLSWSVAKSVSSTLAGAAVHRGAMSLDDSICLHLTEYAGKAVCAIKVRHAVTFGSGLAWQESYEGSEYTGSSVIAMFFGVGRRDHLAHILGHRLAGPPGTIWNYSTGDSALVAAVTKRALQRASPRLDFWSVLFDRLGISATFEEDARGTPNGGSHVFATPRDFAKLGYLMLADGCWDGERLLPEGWVAQATSPSEVFLASGAARGGRPTGASWWLNRSLGGGARPWPDVPDDMFTAIGHWGQYVAVIPTEDLVVVRMGDDRSAGISLNELLHAAIEVAR